MEKDFSTSENRAPPQHQQDDLLSSGQMKGFGLVLAAGASDLSKRPHVLELRTRQMAEMRLQQISQEMSYLKADNDLIKNAVTTLESDRDNLRQAIRKLKVENSRIKLKMKRLASAIGGKDGDMEVDGGFDFDEIDYNDIKDFLLVGGPKDPFSLRFEATIKDANDKEHKSAERYLWYKMAENFGDTEAMEKIREAETGAKAEEEMGKIKNFDEAAWNKIKMKFWEEAQKLKFEQVRWIQALLVYSDKMYIAISSQDKLWGTGWRKQREEASQPKMWDGENEGGKTLMKIRDQLKPTHKWMGDDEEEETKKKYDELKRTFWRRQQKRDFEDGGYGGGGRGGRGGRGFEGGNGRGFVGGRGGGGRGGRGDSYGKRPRY